MTILRFEPTGAPKGFTNLKEKVSPKITAMAKQVLKELFNKGFGAAKIVNIDGINYCFKLEKHWHPLDYKYGPKGDHQGITVYVQSSSQNLNSENKNSTKPSNDESGGAENGRLKLLKRIDNLLNQFK